MHIINALDTRRIEICEMSEGGAGIELKHCVKRA